MTTRWFLFAGLVVAVAASLMFLPGLPGEFIFDDIPNIVTNPVVHLTDLGADGLLRLAFSEFSGHARVLPMLTFGLDYWRAGSADPATFKITNICIHALTAFVLAWFFRSVLRLAGVPMSQVKWAAPALALAWALHPLQVSSVLYVVQRLQTMGTLFVLLALCTYLGARQAQIEGRSGRTGMLLTVMLWLVALGCKEDTALLPAYTLALELTVLRFAAQDAGLARKLRRGYLLAVLAGAVAYLFVVVPAYWQWDTLGGREFSTLERVLTQPRVLCIYLWQILLPLPSHMPFYYDWLQPSRSLLQPWTTLPSILLVVALLVVAWRLRTRQPLFSLGVFLFFAAHFIASNVIGLELAFEHRNHFALVGAVLAIGATLGYFTQRFRLSPKLQATVVVTVLVALSGATLFRSHTWKDNLSLSRASVESAPGSGRAWTQLCAAYFEQGGGVAPHNPNLDAAIDVCEKGTAAVPRSLNSPTLLIVLKTIRGDVSRQDWDLLQQRIKVVPMTLDNARVDLILTFHARKGVALDKQQLLATLDALVQASTPTPYTLAYIGYFVMNELDAADQAMPYFTVAVRAASPRDPFPQQLAAELRQKGRPDLAEEVEQLALAGPRMQP